MLWESRGSPTVAGVVNIYLVAGLGHLGQTGEDRPDIAVSRPLFGRLRDLRCRVNRGRQLDQPRARQIKLLKQVLLDLEDVLHASFQAQVKGAVRQFVGKVAVNPD